MIEQAVPRGTAFISGTIGIDMRALRACVATAAFIFCSAAYGQAGLSGLLANASSERGEQVFRKCQACHTVEKGGPNRVGPNIYGVIDRPVAVVEDYRYSPALQGHGGEWSVDRLDEYLEDPRAVVKGTRMVFPGLKDPQDRADLIAYLNTHSDDPMPLDQAGGGEETDEAEASPEAGQDFGQLFIAEGVEETYYACTACHSEMIVAQQGKTREGWAKTLEWMVEEQGMQEIPQPEHDIILDYLADHYNTDRPNFPRRSN